jgi:hypothetical protein
MFLLSSSEIDFNKNFVDMVKMKYYLSQRILYLNKMEQGAPIPMEKLTNQVEVGGGLGKLVDWIGNNQRELDPDELDRELHANTHILLDDEKVLMAFKAGRDTSLFTNLRVMTLDVQGLSGQKIEYTTLPYRSIRAFSVETAGVWDRDTELNLYTRNRWDMAKVEMDFRTGKADIIQINKFLAAMLIGLPTDPKVDMGNKDYVHQAETDVAGAASLWAAFFDNSKETDATEMDAIFRTNPKLLLDEEKVIRAFKQARDMFVYTTRRIIFVDAKGLSGKRVKYKSIPYRFVKGFEFETAGHLDRDAEIYAHTSIANVVSTAYPRIVPSLVTKQSILVKHFDIYEMGKLFTDHVLFGEEYNGVPDIFLDEPEILF